MADYSDFIKNNVAPYAAKKIGVYNSSGTRVGEIALGDFKPDYGERLYRFGLLSDVHNETDQTTDNSEDLKNALSYFNDKEDIEFTIISGDLTQYSYSTQNIATEMALFQTNAQAVSPSTPIYPTTGNHDCPNSSSDIDITTFYSYTDVADIAPASDAEYSYEITKTHTTSGGTTVTDHFLFLTMKRYEFSSETYSSTDITWLQSKLEAYKTDRCFVITHMFIPTYSGNLNDIYPSGNWLSGTMLTSVKNLVDSYPRAIWFNGHSHWKWYLQKYQDRANIYPTSNTSRTTAWCVHLPSCASPIDSDGSSTRVAMAGQSEGGICDVYENYVVIRGIEFKGADDTDYVQRYIPVAQYLLMTEPDAERPEGLETYTITYNLTNSTSSVTTKSIEENSSYSTIISSNSGYSLSTLTVTMGGTDVTSTYVNGSKISINGVTGNIVITATSVSAAYSITYNLNESTSTNNNSGANSGDSYTTLINHNSGYLISSIVVTMGGTDISSTAISTATDEVADKKITIDSITGDVVITVTTTQALTTLIANCNTVSSGLSIMVPNSTYKYLKYDEIKLTTSDGTDITSTVTSTNASTSNSYKVGAYNSNSVYQYVTAGEILETTVNENTSTETGTQIPLIQASSSSNVATTSIYVQVKGLKYSANQIDWVEVNSGSTILNGSEWGKNDIPWGWFEDIVEDPTTVTLAKTLSDGTVAS